MLIISTKCGMLSILFVVSLCEPVKRFRHVVLTVNWQWVRAEIRVQGIEDISPKNKSYKSPLSSDFNKGHYQVLSMNHEQN